MHSGSWYEMKEVMEDDGTDGTWKSQEVHHQKLTEYIVTADGSDETSKTLKMMKLMEHQRDER